MAYIPDTPQQFGPGTALIQSYGMGAYVDTQNYFLTPAGASGIRGMGCACGCGGECDGMGTFMDGTGLLGTGLFTSSTPADWGPGEWIAIVLGGYIVLSVFDTSRRVGRSAAAAGRAASQEYGLKRRSGSSKRKKP